MPVRKIFSNQSALRKRIDDLEDLLRGMHEQREQVDAVLRVMEDWARELREFCRKTKAKGRKDYVVSTDPAYLTDSHYLE